MLVYMYIPAEPYRAVLIILLCVITPSAGCGRGKVYIRDNGYRDVLIAIGEAVDEDPRLVDRIKEVFTQASEMLHTVTRLRAYFGNITILVPQSWSSHPSYGRVATESLDHSDIVVDLPDPLSGQGDVPFVLKTTPCGEPGQYMQLTPEFLLTKELAGEMGGHAKVVVHEWAHLRYGVFDEFPTGGVPHFYAGPHGDIEGTRCSLAIPGEMYNIEAEEYGCDYDENGLPEADCVYLDKEMVTGKVYGSLMYRQYLDHIGEFCDDDADFTLTLHNSEAPTQQNNLCKGKSIWQVLREHPDFSKNNNPPREVPSTVPHFRVVRDIGRRTVLVLDISGSMNKGGRIGKLAQACSHFISEQVLDGEQLGVIWFSTSASTKRELTVVTPDTRLSLLDAIPTDAEGRTAIAAGILEAIKLLDKAGGTSGASVIVVSDGRETIKPFLHTVWDQILSSNITIHSIAITDDTETRLDVLSMETGGKSFLYSTSEESNALNEAFSILAGRNQHPLTQKQTLKSEAHLLLPSASILGHVIVDESVGTNTEFLFDYTASEGIQVRLTSPGGKTYDGECPELTHNKVFGIYKFVIPDQAEKGKWTYAISSTTQDNQQVAVTVTSQPRKDKQSTPIICYAFWGSRQVELEGTSQKQALYVSVSKGYAPVLKANVTAEIERPLGSTSVIIRVKDNGAGADITADDGIYSAYFLDYSDNGRYSVKVLVNGDATTVVWPGVVGKGAAINPKSTQKHVGVATGQFQRVTSAGSFELQGYHPDVVKAFPPSGITDLSLKRINYDQMCVILEWTATGDILDVGNASHYELRLSQNFSDILSNFSTGLLVTPHLLDPYSDLQSPLAAGSRESLSVRVPQTGNVRYVFGIRAHASTGQVSEVSNLVSVSMIRRVSLSRGPGLTAVILSSLFTALLITVIIFVIICVIRSRTNEKQAEKKVYDPVTVRSTWTKSKMDNDPGNLDAKENVYDNII